MSSMHARWMLPLLAAPLLGGCGYFRLSDPFYAFKSIEVVELEPSRPCLLYGTVEMPPGLFSAPIDSIELRQIGPEDKRLYWSVTENHLFRAFRRRSLKSGTFVFVLPPGVYELEHLESTLWGRSTTWTLGEDSRVQSRVYLTRPGVYDLGTLRVSAPDGFFKPYRIDSLNDSGSPQRKEALRALVRGTAWERYMP